MRYGVLGPLEVVTDAGTARLGGQKERLVLAVLLARANEAVSAGQLVTDLWGADPPRTAGKTLQGYVSRVRRALPESAIRTVAVMRRGREIARLGPGDVVGELALLDGTPRVADAWADGPLEVLVQSRQELAVLRGLVPSVAQRLERVARLRRRAAT